MESIALGVAMAVLGHVVHLLKRVVEARSSGAEVGIIEYVAARRYRTALGVAGSAVAMGFLIEANQVTAMGAFAVGYMADSGLAMLREKSP